MNTLVLTTDIDFNLFFERVVCAAIATRVQLIYSVATEDTFAARCFKAYSATAKLKVIVALCQVNDVEVA